jgi:hypothetical protein
MFCRDYLEMSPEERRRRFQDIMSSVSRSAIAMSPYNVSYTTYPATEEFIVSVPGYAVRQGDLLFLELPGLTRAIAGVTSDERSNPLYRDSFLKQYTKIEVLLPEGAKTIELRPPETKEFQLPGSSIVTLSTKITLPDQKSNPKGRISLLVEQLSDIKPGLVRPDKYADLLDVNHTVANPDMRTIVVRMDKLKIKLD